MQYGHFDNKSREYVIDRVDLPVSWTNYIGVGDMYGVFNHTAGGYLLYKTPEYHRITRFRPNGVPMDGPGHYIYIRDDETGDYWSVSWQPVGRDMAKYSGPDLRAAFHKRRDDNKNSRSIEREFLLERVISDGLPCDIPRRRSRQRGPL